MPDFPWLSPQWLRNTANSKQSNVNVNFLTPLARTIGRQNSMEH